MARDDTDRIRARLDRETGTLVDHSPEAVCLLYPSPYHTGMSSLGFQTIYRAINARAGRAAHRAFLPDELETANTILTYEVLRPVGDYRVIGLSVAYELELAGLVRALQLAGIPPLARDRGPEHPFILAGGPLTFSNPLPLAPFADAILMGEADDSIHQALDLIFQERGDPLLRALAESIPSAFVPSLHGDEMPPVARADDVHLPARSQITTPDTELRDMFLIEPERGCHRGCTYCVMRRSTNGGMRLFDPETVIGHVPDHAKRVGLVGAATTDHPRITDIVESLVDSGREVGLSSLRADRLNDRFVAALRKGGQTVLTTAADGASARLRKEIQRRAPDEKLREAAHLVKRHGMRRLKLYMMLGLPDETDDDIDELVEFSVELSRIAPLSLGIAPFCAKRNTPMDGLPFAGIATVDGRLKRLRKGVKGRVDLRATSARWAWVEYVLAQGGRAEGEAVMDVVARGGKFRHWKAAFEALPTERPRRALVRPGDRVLRVVRSR